MKADFPDGSVLDRETVYKTMMFGTGINSMCQKVIRREIFDRDADYEPWKDVRRATDKFQTYPLIANAEKIVYLDKALYCYRKTTGSITTSRKISDYRIYYLLWEWENRFVAMAHLSEQQEKKLNASRMAFLFGYIEDAAKADYSEFEQFAKDITENSLFDSIADNMDKQYISILRCRGVQKLIQRDFKACYYFCRFMRRLKNILGR